MAPQLETANKGLLYPNPWLPSGVATAAAMNCPLSLKVADTGIGISPDALERVFTPFERVQPATAAKIEGTGLGLAIARCLVRLHGGTVNLERALGSGTRATVTLPANRVIALKSAAEPLSKQAHQTVPLASGP